MIQSLCFLVSIPICAAISEWSEFQPTSRPSLNLEFIFPDQLRRLPKRLSPFVPEGCASDDFCENVSDYPDTHEIINKLKESTSLLERQIMFTEIDQEEKVLLRSRFREEGTESRLPKIRGTILRQNTSQDFKANGLETNLPGREDVGFVRESPACDSEESFVYPRTARNRKRQWRFVINVPGEDGEDNYVQAVKVEKCIRQGESCNIASSGFETTVCRQKYTYRRLLAFGDDGSQYVDSFRFPSCCVCFQQKSFSYDFELLRNAPENTTARTSNKMPLHMKENQTRHLSNAQENNWGTLRVPKSKYQPKAHPMKRTNRWKWKKFERNLLRRMLNVSH